MKTLTLRHAEWCPRPSLRPNHCGQPSLQQVREPRYLAMAKKEKEKTTTTMVVMMMTIMELPLTVWALTSQEI